MINTVESNKFIGNPQYRGLSYKKDINRDTVRFIKKYKKKIGYQLGGTVESMMTRRGQMILMIANAGGGKTYCVLQTMAKLSMIPANDNVRYVIAVPNRNQSNQNQKSNVLSQFKAVSIVGSKDGSRKVEVNTITNKIFSCVYDKALDVVEILQSNGHEVVLVLDECHKLISDNNFRGEAIAKLEKACRMASQSIMMTATPRRCLEFYKYSEIYNLVDEDAQNNIEDFRVVLSENNKMTLYKEIRKILNKKVNIVKEEEVWEDTLEVIPPETLLEILESPKYKTVKNKTATLITSKEVDVKVLVRLNSIKQIESYISILEKAGIKAEKLTRKEKDGEVFRSIEEQSKIITESRVIFCTSVVECGVSLENQDIYLIEMIRSARDFDCDNTVQFFARPRKTIGQGILIIPDYINKTIREQIKKEAKEAKKKSVEFNELEELTKRKKNFTASKDMIEAKAKANYYKELKKIDSRYETLKNKFISETHELANFDLSNIMEKVRFIKEKRGEESARAFLKDEITNQGINNPYYINVIEADLESLEAYIDDKKVIDKAFKEMDKDILRFNPWMFIDYFEGKIFYNTISIEHCTIMDEIDNDKEKAKEYKDLVKYMKELSEAQNQVKAMKLEKARELLNDEEFTKLLDDIVEGNIYKENLSEFTDKYTIKDILSFKETSVYNEYKKAKKVFDSETSLHLVSVRVITEKAITNRYKKAVKVDKTLTRKDFEKKMNIVPEANEIRYLKGTEINDIIERKHIIENLNSVGVYRKGLNDKHSAIMDVILPAKTKNGKQASIRPSKDLLLKLNIELVDRKVYEDVEMKKVINKIKKDADKLNIKADLYSSVNIKKLEAVYSSNDKNEIKMLNEISKVFNLAKDNTGYKINGVVKTFDMASIISSIH